MTHQSGCLVCGAELCYAARREARVCALCGAQFEAEAACSAGHYVCDGCHRSSAVDLIFQTCLRTELADPVALATRLMRSPLCHMHGPEHHFLVAAVIVAAACNARGNPSAKEAFLIEARRRAEGVPGGICGFWGSCGAGIGVGIAVSILTRATPLSKAEWRMANSATSAALGTIAVHGGPRCCKRNTYLALRQARQLLREQLGVELTDGGVIRCEHARRNRECLAAECPFFSPMAA